MRRIHRWGGLVLAAFVIFYCLTGLLLNHRQFFDYFLVRQRSVTRVPVSDPALLRSFIETYKRQIKRVDDPGVIRIRAGKTIEFLYGSHGRTTYVIDPAAGTMERIDKSPRRPWNWLNRLHKAFRTGPVWLALADLAAAAILLLTLSGLVILRYRLLDYLLVFSGVVLLVFGMVVA